MLGTAVRSAFYSSTNTSPEPQPSKPIYVPPPVYQVFKKQDDALKFAQTNPGTLRVFAEELATDGSRHYIVTSYLEFWFRYQRMQKRYFSELIAAECPCHIYFDVEFPVDCNPTHNGQKMIEILKEAVLDGLVEHCGIARSRVEMLDLDSSNPKKFSHHLVFRIDGAAFSNNTAVGQFVRDVCVVLERKARDDPTCPEAQLLVSGSRDTEPDKLFVDMAVYTRNRCFRLLGSCKHSQATPFLPFGIYHAISLPHANTFNNTSSTGNHSNNVTRCANLFFDDSQNAKKWFFRSLICNTSPNAHIIKYTSSIAPSNNKTMFSPGSYNCFAPSSLTSSPYLPLACFIVSFWDSRIQQPQTMFDVLPWLCAPTTSSSNVLSLPQIRTGISTWGVLQDSDDSAASNNGSSHFNSNGNSNGNSNSSGKGSFVFFVLRNNRWCGRIDREHKSNHVRLIVSLSRAVCCQRCFDPDCEGYKSPEFPVPTWLVQGALGGSESQIATTRTTTAAAVTAATMTGASAHKQAVQTTNTFHSSSPTPTIPAITSISTAISSTMTANTAPVYSLCEIVGVDEGNAMLIDDVDLLLDENALIDEDVWNDEDFVAELESCVTAARATLNSQN